MVTRCLPPRRPQSQRGTATCSGPHSSGRAGLPESCTDLSPWPSSPIRTDRNQGTPLGALLSPSPPYPPPSGSVQRPLSLRPCGLSTRTCVPACVPKVLSTPSTELRRPELVGMCVLKLMGAIKLAKREKGWIGSPWLVLRNDPPALAKGCPVGFRPPRRLCSPAHSAEGPRPQGGKGSGAARGGHPGTGVPFSPSQHPALSRRRGLEGCGICPLQTPRAAHTHARP